MQRKRIWKPIQFEPGDTRLVDMNQDYKNGEKTSHNTTSICGHLVSEDSQDLLAKLRFPDANKQMTNQKIRKRLKEASLLRFNLFTPKQACQNKPITQSWKTGDSLCQNSTREQQNTRYISKQNCSWKVINNFNSSAAFSGMVLTKKYDMCPFLLPKLKQQEKRCQQCPKEIKMALPNKAALPPCVKVNQPSKAKKSNDLTPWSTEE